MDNLKSGIMKKLFIISFLIISTLLGYSQDQRTTDTKVADLLARMPVSNISDLKLQMQEMSNLGSLGRQQIIDMIVPPGGGNDTSARFAIESYSRYLSEYGHDQEKYAWESECIEAVYESGYPMVRSFFLSQLKYIGSVKSVEFAVGFLTDPDLCEPAMAVITSSESPGKEDILAVSLQMESLECPESVMNELARVKSDKAILSYMTWYMKGDKGIKAAALNAMAESADKNVYGALERAAADVSYGWDETGATAALVQYARNVGDKGDLISMERICRDLFSKASVQYRLAALEALVHCKGYEAIEYLLSGFRSGDFVYRKAILNIALGIPGKAATRRWMNLIGDLDETRKAEIIEMLGERGDELAIPAVKGTLFCPSVLVRTASAMSLVKLQGRESVQELIDYIRSYETAEDQVAGYRALLTVLDSRKRDLVADALDGSSNNTKATMLILLASGGENRFFDTLMKYTSSDDQKLRTIAFMELKSVAGPSNQQQLVDLLVNTNDNSEIEHVQDAITTAVNQINNKEERASLLLSFMEDTGRKDKLIPVLAKIGGQKALKIVYEEFEKGNAEMREITYKALSDWADYSSYDALYDICASGNKNYSEKAFYDYIKKVENSPLNGKEKLALLQDILPFALKEDQKTILEAKLISVKESISEEDVKPEESGSSMEYFVSAEEKEDGFMALFNGMTLDNWIGDKETYIVEDGFIVVKPDQGSGGNIYTRDEYSNFILRFEFQLSPGANNGLAIRAPLTGNAAYVGMELQIIDNTDEIYSNLQPYQYHGSVYGVIPAKKGFLKPIGEWNEQEVIADGNKIKVILNGTVIVDGDISEAIENGTMDKRDHPGLERSSGHIGFLGYGSPLKFRKIRIKEL